MSNIKDKKEPLSFNAECSCISHSFQLKELFIEKLISDNKIGVGIFSAPGFILINANQTLLNYLSFPYSTMGSALGRNLHQLFPGIEESCGIDGWMDLVENGRSIYVSEKKGVITGSENKYWSNALVPLKENGQLKYLVFILFDVSEFVLDRERITTQVKMNMQKMGRAELLSEIAGLLLKNDNPLKIIKDICMKVMAYLDCNTFFNYIVEDQRIPRLHLNACAGVSADSVGDLEWLDFGVSVCGCAAKDGCSLVVADIQKTTDERTEFLKSIGIRAYACNPLMHQDKVIGTLAFGTDSKDAFDENDLSLMKSVADLASIALNRMRTEQMLASQQLFLIKAEVEKNRILKSALEMKDEFISLISHEFKTPLTVINSAVQTMQLTCRSELSGKAKGFLGTILQNSNRQLKLVNDLLDITRANAGHLKVNRTNQNIVSQTKAIVESIKIYADQKSIRLSYNSTLRTKVIAIDEEKYERILLNLLSNAVKYTPAGKSIDVLVFQKVVEGKYKVCVQVRDSGIGIPKDMVDVIFERFGQVDQSLSRRAEGTGIGLYLVKILVELLDGRITLESKEGYGSKFTVLLPVGKIKEKKGEPMAWEIIDSRLIQATALEFSDVHLSS